MKHWPETATAVGITLTPDGIIEVAAPCGLEDLFALVLRQSPYCSSRDIFMNRIKEKNWIDRWKLLKII